MTTVTWWTRRFAGAERQGGDAGQRQRRRLGRAAEGRYDLGDRNAFQPAEAFHADRVTDADRAGEAGRAAIGDRDLERAGLADLAFLVARLLDVDGAACCRPARRPRRTDRRCRCRGRDPSCRVRSSRSGRYGRRLDRHVEVAAGSGRHDRAGDLARQRVGRNRTASPFRAVGCDGEDLDGVPVPRTVAASLTRTGPVGAAVPTLMTVMRQDTAAPAAVPFAGLGDAQRPAGRDRGSECACRRRPCCW